MTSIGGQMRGEISMIRGEIDHVTFAIDGYEKSECFSPDSRVMLYAVMCSMERIETALKNFEDIAKRADEWHIVPQNIVTSSRGKKKRKEAKPNGQGSEDTDSETAPAL